MLGRSPLTKSARSTSASMRAAYAGKCDRAAAYRGRLRPPCHIAIRSSRNLASSSGSSSCITASSLLGRRVSVTAVMKSTVSAHSAKSLRFRVRVERGDRSEPFEYARDQRRVAVDVVTDLEDRGLAVAAGQRDDVRFRHHRGDAHRPPRQSLEPQDQANLFGKGGRQGSDEGSARSSAEHWHGRAAPASGAISAARPRLSSGPKPSGRGCRSLRRSDGCRLGRSCRPAASRGR